MKRILKGILAAVICAAMVFGTVCFEGIDFPSLRASAVIQYTANQNTVKFGSYPQWLVTDDSLLSRLNAKSKSWKYFDYYSGDGSYGSMTKGKYMMYADVTLDGNKFRAVTFSRYRPNTSCGVPDAENSYQDRNGYYINEVYWFIYAPIEWLIVDPGLGLLMSTRAIDAQPYSNFIYWADSDADGIKDKDEVYNNESCTTYANDYASSSIREWLNDDFYNTAFSSAQKRELKTVTLNNKTYVGANSKYNSKETKDKVFIFSHFEASNDGYNIEGGAWARIQGSDYARCQGLFTGSSGLTSTNSHCWLRTAGSTSYTATNIHASSVIHSDGVSVNNTYLGVCPVIKVELEYVPPETVSEELDVIPDKVGPWCISFTDKGTEKPLAKSELTFNGETIKTSAEYGARTFSAEEMKSLNRISLDGYNDYIFPNYVIDNEVEHIYLERCKSYNKPYVSSVYIKKHGTDTSWKNLAAEEVAISEDSGGGGFRGNAGYTYDILITAWTNSPDFLVEKICLTQDGTHTLESSGTVAMFSDKDLDSIFIPNKDIIAYCVDSEGNVSPAFETKLSITEKSKFKQFGDEVGVELFSDNGTSVTIPDSVPILGGTKWGLNFGKVPIGLSKEGQKFKLSVGLMSYDGKEGEASTIFDKDEWDQYKKDLKAVEKAGKEIDKYRKLEAARKKYNFKKVGAKIVGTPKLDFDVFGYAEFEMVNGEIVITDSFIGLSVTGGYSWLAPYVVLGIPCYTKLNLSLKVSQGGKLHRIVADNAIPLEWDITLTIDPSATITAGVGIPSFINLEVDGKASFSWYQQLIDKYLKMSLTFAASIKANAFLASISKEFAKETIVLKDGVYGSPSTASVSTQDLKPIADYYNSENYTEIAARDYLENSQWIGGASTYFETSSISVKGYETSTLMSSVYSDSRQQLINLENGNKLLVFITDNASRSSENRTMLAYSLYNAETGIWSEPKAVADDGTADFYPDIASDGKNVWVAWQNMNSTLDSENAVLDNYSAASEICAAQFNPESGSFGPAYALTSDSELDMLPVIACKDGDVRIAWVNNIENDIFGFNGKNSIMTSSFNGSSWSEPGQLKSDIPAISAVDAAIDNGKFYVAYACDENNDYSDMSDMEIYRITDDGSSVSETRITENQVLDSAPQFGVIGGETKLVWYSENNLYTLTSLDGTETVFEEATNVTDSFVIADSGIGTNYIIWSQNVGEHPSFFAVVYDGGQWSKPVLIGESDGKAVNPAATVNDDGTIMIAYNSVGQELITVPGVDGAEDFSYYEDTQTDLAVLKVYQNANVTVTDNFTYIECEQAVPGNEVPLTVTVTNSSISALKSVDMYIDGALNSTVAVDLLPGESKDITVNYTMPETIVHKEIEIKALPSGTDDFDLSDNTVTTEYGYTELSVNNIMITDLPSSKYICATIDNESAVDSGEFRLRVRENSADGNIILEETVTNLQAGKARYIGFDVDKTSVEYDENGMKIYYIEVETESKEYTTANNNDYVTFTDEDSDGATASILRVNASQGTADVYGVIENNEYGNNTVYAKTELLDAEGNVIGLSVDKIDLVSRELYTYEKSIDIHGGYHEARITLIDEKDIVNVSGISLNTAETEIYLSHSQQLTASVSPENATDPSVVWISSDESVATVSPTGEVTALSVGSAIITAVTKDGGKKALCYVNVIPNDFTATWVVDGEEIQTTVTEGDPVILPETPQKTGYSFLGWSPQVPDVMPAENLTFTAMWAPISCSAVFDAQGGKWQNGEEIRTVTVDYDSRITAPEAPEKEGYIFSGWLLDGVNVGTDTGIMDNPDGKKFTAVWIASDRTRYTVETYTMTPYGEYIKSVTVLQGTTDERIVLEPEIENGFVLSEEKSVLSGSVSADNSLVLKVYTDRLTYTFTTVVDGVESSMDYYYGATVAQPRTPVRKGYRFTEWSQKIPDTMPAEDIEVSAGFEAVEYQAIFVADGTEIARVPYTVETVSVEIPDVPPKKGHSAEWEKFAFDAGGVRVNAIYTPNTYKITWKADFVTLETELKYGQPITAPDIPEKSGYKTVGWDAEIPETMPDKNLTFTAVYEKTAESKFVCPDCGKEFDSSEALNAHIAQENRPADVYLTLQTPSTAKINYGDTLVMHAQAKNRPAGSRIVWEVSGNGVEIKPSPDGSTCEVISVANGEAVITVKVVDSNGNTVVNSDGTKVACSQKITSKAGIWQKIVSFFKNLFRISRVIPQAFLK